MTMEDTVPQSMLDSKALPSVVLNTSPDLGVTEASNLLSDTEVDKKTGEVVAELPKLISGDPKIFLDKMQELPADVYLAVFKVLVGYKSEDNSRTLGYWEEPYQVLLNENPKFDTKGERLEPRYDTDKGLAIDGQKLAKRSGKLSLPTGITEESLQTMFFGNGSEKVKIKPELYLALTTRKNRMIIASLPGKANIVWEQAIQRGFEFDEKELLDVMRRGFIIKKLSEDIATPESVPLMLSHEEAAEELPVESAPSSETMPVKNLVSDKDTSGPDDVWPAVRLKPVWSGLKESIETKNKDLEKLKEITKFYLDPDKFFAELGKLDPNLQYYAVKALSTIAGRSNSDLGLMPEEYVIEFHDDEVNKNEMTLINHEPILIHGQNLKLEENGKEPDLPRGLLYEDIERALLGDDNMLMEIDPRVFIALNIPRLENRGNATLMDSKSDIKFFRSLASAIGISIKEKYIGEFEKILRYGYSVYPLKDWVPASPTVD